MRAPASACVGCGGLVGCKKCVNRYYRGGRALLKTCPLCRATGGFKKAEDIRGFNELINQIKIMEDVNTSDEDSAEEESEEDEENDTVVVED